MSYGELTVFQYSATLREKSYPHEAEEKGIKICQRKDY
jgi:hypothetical protein